MSRLIIFLLAITAISALNPTLKACLRQHTVALFKDAVVRVLAREFKDVPFTIPDFKAADFTIHITDAHAGVEIAPGNIAITFTHGVAGIHLHGAAITMGGEAHVHARGTISKTMRAVIEISQFGFDCVIAFSSTGVLPHIDVKQFNVLIDDSHVKIHLHGDIIVHIVDHIVNAMKPHIVSQVKSEMHTKVPPIIDSIVNRKLRSLPTDIDVAPHLNLKYLFQHAPIVLGPALISSDTFKYSSFCLLF